IDGEHVHRYATCGTDFLAAHEHRRAVWRMTWISVGVTASHHADAHCARRRIGATVADALVGLQVLNPDQRALERHYRAKSEHFRGIVAKRRRAIEHDAGTNVLAAD